MEAKTAGSSGRGWLYSPAIDLLILWGPWAFAAGLIATKIAPLEEPGLAVWLSQFVLGNTTHVILTFVLLGFRRDILRATPSQPRLVVLGSVVTFFLCWGLFRGVDSVAPAWSSFPIAVAAIFGTHHRLSQAKGVWSLYNLRASRLGFDPPSSAERSLQQVWVSLGLVLLMISWLFVPSGPSKMFPVFQAIPHEPAMLPYEVDYALAGVWGVFVGALLVALGREGRRNWPKMIHVSTHGLAIGLALVAPVWGAIVWGGIHGLEYYFLCGSMMKGREGDSFAPEGSTLGGTVVVWLLMGLSMLPLVFVGLAQTSFAHDFAPGPGLAKEGLMILNAVVLAHYFADAFIYRFRIPEVRKVALKRLGFA